MYSYNGNKRDNPDGLEGETIEENPLYNEKSIDKAGYFIYRNYRRSHSYLFDLSAIGGLFSLVFGFAFDNDLGRAMFSIQAFLLLLCLYFYCRIVYLECKYRFSAYKWLGILLPLPYLLSAVATFIIGYLGTTYAVEGAITISYAYPIPVAIFSYAGALALYGILNRAIVYRHLPSLIKPSFPEESEGFAYSPLDRRKKAYSILKKNPIFLAAIGEKEMINIDKGNLGSIISSYILSSFLLLGLTIFISFFSINPTSQIGMITMIILIFVFLVFYLPFYIETLRQMAVSQAFKRKYPIYLYAFGSMIILGLSIFFSYLNVTYVKDGDEVNLIFDLTYFFAIVLPLYLAMSAFFQMSFINPLMDYNSLIDKLPNPVKEEPLPIVEEDEFQDLD